MHGVGERWHLRVPSVISEVSVFLRRNSKRFAHDQQVSDQSRTVDVLADDGLEHACPHETEQSHVAQGRHGVVPAGLVLGKRVAWREGRQQESQC